MRSALRQLGRARTLIALAFALLSVTSLHAREEGEAGGAFTGRGASGGFNMPEMAIEAVFLQQDS